MRPTCRSLPFSSGMRRAPPKTKAVIPQSYKTVQSQQQKQLQIFCGPRLIESLIKKTRRDRAEAALSYSDDFWLLLQYQACKSDPILDFIKASRHISCLTELAAPLPTCAHDTRMTDKARARTKYCFCGLWHLSPEAPGRFGGIENQYVELWHLKNVQC